MPKKDLKNYLPQIKKALKNGDIAELLYQIEDQTITDVTDIKIILDLCDDFGEDAYLYLTGQRDMDYLLFLAGVTQVEYEIAQLPIIKPEKKNKMNEKGKVVVFDPERSPHKH